MAVSDDALMHVLIPILGLTPHGGNRVLVQIANEFVRRGHTVDILTPSGPNQMPFMLDPGVRIVGVGAEVPVKFVRWLTLLVSIPFHRADCVVVNHFVTAMAGRWAELIQKRRVVYLVQDIEYRFYRWPLRAIARLLCHWTYRAREVVPANAYLANELRKEGAAPRPSLRLGVDPFFIDAPRPPAEMKQFDVVCILRRESHKRADRLLALAELLRAGGISTLCICQDEALIGEHRHRFTVMTRPRSDQELCAAFDAGRLFVLTSDHEGFSLPPLECMARGLPTVLFPCGGPELYARDGYNCIVVVDERIETAYREISAVLADPARYDLLSQGAGMTAKAYDMTEAAGDFVSRCLLESPTEIQAK